MKFVALALLGVVSAVKVNQHHVPARHSMVQARCGHKAHQKAKSFV